MADTTVRAGQVYEACHPDEKDRRIRVVSDPWGGRAQVETVTESGRGIRRRSILISGLYASGTTDDGKPRLRGYRLVSDAPSGEEA